MTLDDLSISEQAEYCDWSDSLPGGVAKCHTCGERESNYQQALEEAGWYLGERFELCPKHAMDFVDLDQPVFKRGEICDGCHRTDMFVTEADSGKYCESCFEERDEAQLFIAAMGGV